MSQFSTVLSCGWFTLRPWRSGDEGALVKHANNREVWNNLRDAFPHPYTHDDAVNWIQFVAEQGDRPKRFAVVLDDEPIGGVGIMIGEDVDCKVAEVGYWIGQDHWGNGIATEALRCLSKYAFATFDLVRLQAPIFEWNRASARVAEKAGYTLEGQLEVPRDEIFWDTHVHCCINC